MSSYPQRGCSSALVTKNNSLNCCNFIIADAGLGDSESYHINFDGTAAEPGKCEYYAIMQLAKIT